MKPMVCGAVLYNPWRTQIKVADAKGLKVLVACLSSWCSWSIVIVIVHMHFMFCLMCVYVIFLCVVYL